jgi:two-component system CheB/CheR fusion protein
MQPEPLSSEQILEQILGLLVRKTGVNFRLYKPTTLHRRVIRRMHLLGMQRELDYLEYLRSDEQEQHLLYKEMLIHVTSFFRDEASFDYLCSEVIPMILESRPKEELVRVWVCGCATGEEAYSIAMCFHEHFKNAEDLSRIKIFASDLSDTAIARARHAVYPRTSTARLNEHRLDTYFNDYKGQKQVKSFIRNMCVFAVHDVLSHPPFPNIDLLSCRNVLIYMKPVLQKKVLATFSYALRQNGFLFLGKSENSGLSGTFETINKSANIFRNRARNTKLFRPNTRNAETKHIDTVLQERSTSMEKKDFQRAADDLLLTRYVPAGVVVNDNLDIVDFRGNTGFFVEPSPGTASLNVLKMIRKGLYFDLQEALQQVRAEKNFIRTENIAIEHDGRLMRINIEVQPLPGTKEKFYLILFQDATPPEGPAASQDDGINSTRDLRIYQLEQELMQSREQLRALSEEQEATNEEFQSANEELKTLNEELQTAQEELILTNEELTARNRELQQLNREVSTNDKVSHALIQTINDAVIVLEPDLRVRSANPAFYRDFQLRPETTEGSLIFELSNREWNIPELRRLLGEVLPESGEVIDFRLQNNFQKLGLLQLRVNARIMRNDEDAGGVIFLAFQDQTELQRLRETQQHFRDEARLLHVREQLAQAANQSGVWTYDIPAHRSSLSESCQQLFGYPEQQSPGMDFLFNVLHPDDRQSVISDIETLLSGNREVRLEREFRIVDPATNDIRFIQIGAQTMLNDAGSVVGFTGIAADLSAQRKLEALFRQTTASLEAALGLGRIGTFALRPENNELRPSPQFLNNLGLNDEAGLGYDQFLQLIISEDRDEVSEAIQQAIVRRELFNKEFRVSWPDNSIHWVAACGMALGENSGGGGGMNGVMLDITDRKSSEQQQRYSELQFKTLANSAPVMIALSGSDGVFNFFNRQWLAFTGKSENDFSGSWQSDIHPDDLEEYNHVYKAAIKGRSKFDVRFRLRHNGAYRWVSCSAVPRFSINNQFDGYTLACTDIDHIVSRENLAF